MINLSNIYYWRWRGFSRRL